MQLEYAEVCSFKKWRMASVLASRETPLAFFCAKPFGDQAWIQVFAILIS